MSALEFTSPKRDLNFFQKAVNVGVGLSLGLLESFRQFAEPDMVIREADGTSTSLYFEDNRKECAGNVLIPLSHLRR